MNANEIFEVTLLLWGGVAALFILAGFITGEWVDHYREMRSWIAERRGGGSGSGMSSADGPMPHAS
jgi:hypothetical protein